MCPHWMRWVLLNDLTEEANHDHPTMGQLKQEENIRGISSSSSSSSSQRNDPPLAMPATLAELDSIPRSKLAELLKQIRASALHYAVLHPRRWT